MVVVMADSDGQYGIDYALVLDIITRSEHPAEALKAFVMQEREDAAYKARPAYVYILEAQEDGCLGTFMTFEAAKKFADFDEDESPLDYFGKQIVWHEPDNEGNVFGHFHRDAHETFWVSVRREEVK